MDSVQELLSHPYAEITIGVLGAVALAIGFFMIIRKGLALLFAMLIFGFGIMSLTYVYKGSDHNFLNEAVARFGEVGAKVPNDALRSLCERLDP